MGKVFLVIITGVASYFILVPFISDVILGTSASETILTALVPLGIVVATIIGVVRQIRRNIGRGE